MKILITGGNGQLGRAFHKVLSKFPHVAATFTDRSELDISNQAVLEEYLENNQFDTLINCAAYTAVDQAEQERETAFLINATAVKNIAEVCKKQQVFLVHYSSDYVYHINPGRRLKESDKTVPKGVYAQSKLAGEVAIADAAIPHLIIRTSWVYSEFGHNFVKTMLRLSESRDSLNVVNDQIGCPTYAPDLAAATLEMLSQADLKACSETVNYSNEGQISWYDFASEVFKLADKNMTITGIPTSDYPTPAERPLWSSMDLSKVKATFGIGPKLWVESLEECLEAISKVR